MLHFVPDDAHAFGVVAQLLGPLPAGSYLAISQAAAETYLSDSEQWKIVADIYQRKAATPGAARNRSDVERFFTGMELVDPGVVWVTRWRPDADVRPEFAEHPERSGAWAAVGRKR